MRKRGTQAFQHPVPIRETQWEPSGIWIDELFKFTTPNNGAKWVEFQFKDRKSLT
jgi:hypothetical protein